MGKHKISFLTDLAIILLVSLALLSGLIFSGSWPESHDGLRYLCHLDQFKDAFDAGILYPRWFPNYYGGYGYPIALAAKAVFATLTASAAPGIVHCPVAQAFVPAARHRSVILPTRGVFVLVTLLLPTRSVCVLVTLRLPTRSVFGVPVPWHRFHLPPASRGRRGWPRPTKAVAGDPTLQGASAAGPSRSIYRHAASVSS